MLSRVGRPHGDPGPPAGSASFFDVIEDVQPKIAKIYGSGGLRGLEAYQSGFLISAEGHILTVWSYVLDAEEFLLVVLDDGTRHPAKILNYDPRLEIALLKIEAQGLPHFSLDKGVPLSPGARVLALSNLFGIAVGDEPASVLQGFVAAVSPLAARRGAYQTVYRGPVYVLDAVTNNPAPPEARSPTARDDWPEFWAKSLSTPWTTPG